MVKAKKFTLFFWIPRLIACAFVAVIALACSGWFAIQSLRIDSPTETARMIMGAGMMIPILVGLVVMVRILRRR